MNDWFIGNSGALISSIIGVTGALVGVIITLLAERKRRKKEMIDKAKPIIINYSFPEKSDVLTCLFESDGECLDNITQSSHIMTGNFKNTDNGILFFDCIKTESKIYYPHDNITIDKCTAFSILIRDFAGESLKECKIYFHDIFGTQYFYSAHFKIKSGIQIIIDDSMPKKCSKYRNKR